MKVDYSKGKIYKITNDYNDEIYVGSTCNTLVKRFIQHKSKRKSEDLVHKPLYKLINEIGFDRFRIELIENFPCDDKYQLRQREGYWIRQLGNMNRCIAGMGDKKEYHKHYWKEYYEENNNEYNDNRKKDYHNRKDEIRVRMICECGTDVCKRDLPKHLKTQKHIKLMEDRKSVV